MRSGQKGKRTGQSAVVEIGNKTAFISLKNQKISKRESNQIRSVSPLYYLQLQFPKSPKLINRFYGHCFPKKWKLYFFHSTCGTFFKTNFMMRNFLLKFKYNKFQPFSNCIKFLISTKSFLKIFLNLKSYEIIIYIFVIYSSICVD